MKSYYHREITNTALSAYFHPGALAVVVRANLGQDALRYQIGHDHYHYDNNAFAAGDEYVSHLRLAVLDALAKKDFASARANFGRLTHAVQDFYAHSSYITLWRIQNPDGAVDDVDPLQEHIRRDPSLHSGKIYYPLEAFTFVAAFKPFVIPLLPRDSHAWMNMDDPSCHNFEYAYSAAVKRTLAEYLLINEKLDAQASEGFLGRKI